MANSERKAQASLAQRLAKVLHGLVPVEVEPDGSLTVRQDGTFASLRVVNIVDDLDLVSLTQVLVWDLPLTKKVGDQLAKHARDVNFGKLISDEKPGARPKTTDVLLRYNFPGAGLSDSALRTLILLVLDSGVQIRNALTG